MFICKKGEDGLGWHLLEVGIEQDHLILAKIEIL